MISVHLTTGGRKAMERLITSFTPVKPPNILIYTRGKEAFTECRALFESVIEKDCYTIYHLDEVSVRSTAWLTSLNLLVLACEPKEEEFSSEGPLQSYILNGGRCLSLYPFLPKWMSVTREDGIMKSITGNGIFITPVEKLDQAPTLSSVLNRYFKIKSVLHSKPIPTHSRQVNGYIIAQPFHQEAFFRNLQKLPADLTTLDLSKSTIISSDNESKISLHRNATSRFNQHDYFNVLETKVLGRTCLYFDEVGSTHSVLEGCDSFPDGMVVIARRQTQGRGRAGNVWLSPDGCAMFSIRMRFLLQSELGRHLSLLQHVASLAIVMAVKSQPQCSGLKLGVKWPNDIYYQDKTLGITAKLGGVLVTTSITGNNVTTAIGCGINLNNDKPTLSINQLVKDVDGAKVLSLEHFLPIVFNKLEELITLINSGKLNHVLAMYHEHWLHSGMSVSIRTVKDETTLAQILGIDEHGFLQVKPLNGPHVTVHPDGNSFDMLNGLLVPKLGD